MRKRLDPAEGAVLRVRSATGIYRSHVVSLGRSTWAVSTPLQRDSYIPLRVGEELVVEAASEHGALVFRSEIVARDADSHVLMIKRPERIHRVERRLGPRYPLMAGSEVRIEGQTAHLIDLSEGGARLETGYRAFKGDRIRLDLPWGEPVFGWVLSREGRETRIRFEEPLCRPAQA